MKSLICDEKDIAQLSFTNLINLLKCTGSHICLIFLQQPNLTLLSSTKTNTTFILAAMIRSQTTRQLAWREEPLLVLGSVGLDQFALKSPRYKISGGLSVSMSKYVSSKISTAFCTLPCGGLYTRQTYVSRVPERGMLSHIHSRSGDWVVNSCKYFTSYLSLAYMASPPPLTSLSLRNRVYPSI